MQILNLEPEEYSQEANSILNTMGTVINGPLSREKLIGKIENFDVLITRLTHKIDKEVLDNAKNLKVIVTATTGLNHIDLEAAELRGIKILSLRNETDFLNSISATAEHCWGLLLSLVRHIPSAYEDVKEGRWDRNSFKGHELQDMTIGIIGYGRLGSIVARYAQAFGMKIIINDVKKVDDYPQTELGALLSQADVISIHVSYSAETHHLLNKDNMSQIKPGAFLVNTARGEVIEESALADCLRSGQIAGAALDVLADETSTEKNWLWKNELFKLAETNRNLIITPHIGGATYQSMQKTEIFMAHKLKHFWNSQNG